MTASSKQTERLMQVKYFSEFTVELHESLNNIKVWCISLSVVFRCEKYSYRNEVHEETSICVSKQSPHQSTECGQNIQSVNCNGAH